MRYIIVLFSVILYSYLLSSCSKDNIPAITSPRLDTSTTLISNTVLVGKWNIISDSLSYQGININYKGTAGDHYIFTKYGNLYISEAFGGNTIDTATYDVSNSYVLNWLNIYVNQNGNVSTIPTNSPPFNIRTNADSLVLTSNASTTQGQRYEQIKFIKQ
ncbi:MAG TPA: hypothetical protein VG367_15735 [Mucilaginibacter sp.]|jgi:hypothetical protein|nr:hypothetical protein [Mucilaginibacter sp.]